MQQEHVKITLARYDKFKEQEAVYTKQLVEKEQERTELIELVADMALSMARTINHLRPGPSDSSALMGISSYNTDPQAKFRIEAVGGQTKLRILRKKSHGDIQGS